MTKIYDPKAIPIVEDRRVFYIDVEDMEPGAAKAYMEHLIFEFKNKEIKNGPESNQS